MLRRRRTVRTLVLGGISSALVGCGALVGLGSAAAPADLPDLTSLLPVGQTNPNDRWIDTQQLPGRTLFRFDTVIKNIGFGAFEVYRAGDGTTYQRIWSGGDPLRAGTPKSFPVGAPPAEDVPLAGGAAGGPNALRYSAATGHDHFHSQRIAAYTLLGADGAPVQESSKNLAGFCLYDSWGPPSTGAPSRYPSEGACAAKEPGYTGLLRMGIAEDWGDFYRSQLYDQWVDVTGVTPGTYRLRATVDPDGLYRESNESNNSSEDPAVVIPGVVATPRTVATPAGVPVAIGLSGAVVGPTVKSRRPECTDAQTRQAACMTTADPAAVAYAVAQPAAGRGSVSLAGAVATYTPPRGVSGVVTFTYTGTDSRGLVSAPATVAVRVAAPAGRTTGAGGRGRITLSARQMLIGQRIGQAAIRRLNAVEARLDGGPAPAARRAKGGAVELSVRQMRINQRVYQAAVRRAAALEARIEGRPAPAAAAGGPKGRITLTLRQLVINQHIAQAAVRRANVLDARVP